MSTVDLGRLIGFSLRKIHWYNKRMQDIDQGVKVPIRVYDNRYHGYLL